MAKLSNKALLGCMTLLAAWSSANLKQVSAAEMTSAPTQEGDDSLAVASPTALQPAEVLPDSSTSDSRAAKLAHLVVTSTQPLPVTDSSEAVDSRAAKLAHLAATATHRPPAANSLAQIPAEPEIPAEALPTARVISPNGDSSVWNPVNEEKSSHRETRETPSEQTAVSATTAEQPKITPSLEENLSEDNNQPPQPFQDQTVAVNGIPDGAVPRSRVLSPSQGNRSAGDTATKQVVEPTVVAQAPVQDSSGAVGDSFRPDDLTDEELRQRLSVETPFLPSPIPSPASSFGTPTAYGANERDAFIGLAGVTGGDADTDGSMSLGVGFGDAVESVGVEVSGGIISLDGFADDGQIGFKVHKIFPEADNLAVAVGWSNPITWGDADDAEDTFYGVVTQRFELQPEQSNPLPLTVSVGVGTGSFRSLGAIRAGNNDPNLFGSLGLEVTPNVALVSSWTGSALNAGVSAAPFDFPLVVSAGASDITDNTDVGTRFSASIGYGFKF